MTPVQARSRWAGVALLVLLSLGWGTNWTVMKVALAEVPPMTFRSLSCLVAAFALFAIARLQGRALWPADGEWRPLFVASMLNVAVWNGVAGYALLSLPSGHVALIGYTMPLWLALMTVLVLRQPLPGRVALALAFGLAGTVALLGGDWDSMGQAIGGNLLMLTGAISWAAGTIVLKYAQWPRLGTVALTAWQFLLGGAAMLAVAVAVDPLKPPMVSAAAGWAWAYAIAVGLVFCYWAWFRLVELLSAPAAAVSTLFTPAVGVVTGNLMLNEPLSWKEMAATAAILAGLVLALRDGAPQQPTEA